MTHDEQALLQKLRALAGNQILEIGEIPSAALSAWPARVTNRVIITAERRQHYLFRHPEVVELEALIVTHCSIRSKCIDLRLTRQWQTSIDRSMTATT